MKSSPMAASVSREVVDDRPRKEARATRRKLEKKKRAACLKGLRQQTYLRRTASLELLLVEVVEMEVAGTGEVGATMAAAEITAVVDGEGAETVEAAVVETTTAGEGRKEGERNIIIRAKERSRWITTLPRGMIQATRRNQRDTLIISR
jgi:hypothetical protein